MRLWSFLLKILFFKFKCLKNVQIGNTLFIYSGFFRNCLRWWYIYFESKGSKIFKRMGIFMNSKFLIFLISIFLFESNIVNAKQGASCKLKVRKFVKNDNTNDEESVVIQQDFSLGTISILPGKKKAITFNQKINASSIIAGASLEYSYIQSIEEGTDDIFKFTFNSSQESFTDSKVVFFRPIYSIISGEMIMKGNSFDQQFLTFQVGDEEIVYAVFVSCSEDLEARVTSVTGRV